MKQDTQRQTRCYNNAKKHVYGIGVLRYPVGFFSARRQNREFRRLKARAIIIAARCASLEDALSRYERMRGAVGVVLQTGQ